MANGQAGLAAGRTVDIIYMDERQRFTKRSIRILEAGDSHIRAYCFTRGAYRIFKIDRILAVEPVFGGNRRASARRRQA